MDSAPHPKSMPASLEARLDRLYRRNIHVIRPGLEPMRALCAALDDPQDRFPAIHVAGTNGKGSVCAMTESILRAAGLRTGLYTSPHLIRFNERIRLNGQVVDDAELERIMHLVEDADRRAQAGTGSERMERESTFFEFSTAMAFLNFVDAKVHAGVIETGMGGRLDATNVITHPVVSAITSISLDHTRWLGNSIAAIASEKAGILKANCPVVTGVLSAEAMNVICKIASRLGSTVVEASDFVSCRVIKSDLHGQRLKIETASRSLKPLQLPLPGPHQVSNACVAVAVAELFAERVGFDLPDSAVFQGLENVNWPGRLHLVHQDPPVLVDSAHNEEGAASLAVALRKLAKDRKCAVGIAVGFSNEKDAAAALTSLKQAGDVFWAVHLRHEKAMTDADTAAAFASAGIKVKGRGTLPEILPEAIAWAKENNALLCVAGSVYLAGEALTFLA